MISFAFYTFGKRESSFAVLVFASVFYGLGEAFRSGTHKAMIMKWLYSQKLSKHKTFIYSRTRSFSNMGSALNAVLSIIIMVFLDNYVLVFITSVVPFVADFLMVSTYPSYMNETPNVKKSFFAIMGDTGTALEDVSQTKDKAKPLLSFSSSMAVFTTLKHYIQPIMVLYDALMLSK
jgi:MFS family permease